MRADLMQSDANSLRWFKQHHPGFVSTCNTATELIQAARILRMFYYYDINLLFLDTKLNMWGFNQSDFCKLIDLYYLNLSKETILKNDIISFREKIAKTKIITNDLYRSLLISKITTRNCIIDTYNDVIKFKIDGLHSFINLFSIIMEQYPND